MKKVKTVNMSLPAEEKPIKYKKKEKKAMINFLKAQVKLGKVLAHRRITPRMPRLK